MNALTQNDNVDKMIESISIDNFKSYKHAKMPLSPVTFLIGANASGKSNALEAFRLLSWLAKGQRLDDIEHEIHKSSPLIRGQIQDLFLTSDAPLVLKCELNDDAGDYCFLEISLSVHSGRLTVCKERVFNRKGKTLYETLGEKTPHLDLVDVNYDNFKPGRNPSIQCNSQQAVFFQLDTPARFDGSDVESQKIIPRTVKRFRDCLLRIIFIDPQPGSMRDYAFKQPQRIAENGENLSSVLYNICKDSYSKKTLIDFVQSLPEQKITDISFIETERSDVMVRLHESFGGTECKVDAPLLSDGTLRVLAIAATLLSSPEESVVIIEEIDNGVHPSRAKLLLNQIKDIAVKRKLKVVMSSHNPALMDAVTTDSVCEVLCCYRDKDLGDSRINVLSKIESYPDIVAEGPIGRLMTNFSLERYLKSEETSETRKEKALAWLKEFTRKEQE